MAGDSSLETAEKNMKTNPLVPKVINNKKPTMLPMVLAKVCFKNWRIAVIYIIE